MRSWTRYPAWGCATSTPRSRRRRYGVRCRVQEAVKTEADQGTQQTLYETCSVLFVYCCDVDNEANDGPPLSCQDVASAWLFHWPRLFPGRASPAPTIDIPISCSPIYTLAKMWALL